VAVSGYFYRLPSLRPWTSCGFVPRRRDAALASQRYAPALGHKHVYLKMNGMAHQLLQDRQAAVAVASHAGRCVKEAVIASTGNAAVAMRRPAPGAGDQAMGFMPAWCRRKNCARLPCLGRRSSGSAVTMIRPNKCLAVCAAAAPVIDRGGFIPACARIDEKPSPMKSLSSLAGAARIGISRRSAAGLAAGWSTRALRDV